MKSIIRGNTRGLFCLAMSMVVTFDASLMILPAKAHAEDQQSGDTEIATLEGVVVDAQKKVDKEEDKVRSAEQSAASELPPETKAKWDSDEAEIDGLVVEAKKEEAVVTTSGNRYKKAELALQKSNTAENKSKLDEDKREHERAAGVYEQTENRIAIKRAHAEKILRDAVSITTGKTLDNAYAGLDRARARLAEAKKRLIVAKEGPGIATRNPAEDVNLRPAVDTEPSLFFRKGEVQIQAFGAYATGDRPAKTIILPRAMGGGDDGDSREIKEEVGDKAIMNHAFGAGVAANYFLTRYFGIGAEGIWLDGNRDTWVAMGNFIARYPIEGRIGVAPYLIVGGGGQFDYNERMVAAMGGGVETRFTPNFGAFADARWLFNGKENIGLVRFGFSLSFGGQ